MIDADHAIHDYVRRLERAAAVLPADRRQELLEGIREHLAAARASAAAADEAAVRTLLDRLGEPEEIVAAALEDQGVAGTGAPRSASSKHELAAVLMLTAGSLLVPVIGWFVGVILLWTSTVWRASEKAIGTLVFPGGLGIVFLLAAIPAGSCSSTSEVLPDGSVITSAEVCEGAVLPLWAGVPLAVVLLTAPVVVAISLYRRARRRVAAVGT